MRPKLATVVAFGIILSSVGVGAAAQRSERADEQSSQQSGPGMMGQGMMGQMMMRDGQMSDLMSKLMESMTAIENEKDPDVRKSKLAEHRALLEKMHNEMMQQSGTMRMMSGQATQNCPAASVGRK